MIQTRRTICIVEAKRRKEIGRDIIDEVDRKVRAIDHPAGVSVRTALVYDGEFSPVAATDGYFDAIVPFSRLLGMNGSVFPESMNPIHEESIHSLHRAERRGSP